MRSEKLAAHLHVMHTKEINFADGERLKLKNAESNVNT